MIIKKIERKNSSFNVPAFIGEMDKNIIFSENNLLKLNTFKFDLGNNTVKKIVQGYKHIIVLYENGTVYTMGDNIFGQLGVEKSSEYNKIDMEKNDIDSKIINVYCSLANSFFLSEKGTLYTCGRSDLGLLGHFYSNNVKQDDHIIRPILLTDYIVIDVFTSLKIQYALLLILDPKTNKKYIYSLGSNASGIIDKDITMHAIVERHSFFNDILNVNNIDRIYTQSNDIIVTYKNNINLIDLFLDFYDKKYDRFTLHIKNIKVKILNACIYKIPQKSIDLSFPINRYVFYYISDNIISAIKIKYERKGTLFIQKHVKEFDIVASVFFTNNDTKTLMYSDI